MDSFFIAFYVAESSSLDFKHNECNFYNVMKSNLYYRLTETDILLMYGITTEQTIIIAILLTTINKRSETTSAIGPKTAIPMGRKPENIEFRSPNTLPCNMVSTFS